jgi:hypothetical protein
VERFLGSGQSFHMFGSYCALPVLDVRAGGANVHWRCMYRERVGRCACWCCANVPSSVGFALPLATWLAGSVPPPIRGWWATLDYPTCRGLPQRLNAAGANEVLTRSSYNFTSERRDWLLDSSTSARSLRPPGPRFHNLAAIRVAFSRVLAFNR